MYFFCSSCGERLNIDDIIYIGDKNYCAECGDEKLHGNVGPPPAGCEMISDDDIDIVEEEEEEELYGTE